MTSIIKSKTKIVLVLIAICIVCILLISLSAYSAKLQYSINRVNNKVQEAQWQVRNLAAEVKSSTNISNLEDRAFELGLVYPTFNEITYLQGEQNNIPDFSLALMEVAYH